MFDDVLEAPLFHWAAIFYINDHLNVKLCVHTKTPHCYALKFLMPVRVSSHFLSLTVFISQRHMPTFKNTPTDRLACPF